MKTFTAVALVAALFSSQAQAAFQLGWNKIYISNCLTTTTAQLNTTNLSGGAGVNTGDIQVTVLWIFPDITRTAGLTTADTFSTTDPVYVTELEAFCRNGQPFFVNFFALNPAIWDAISVYPNLK